MNLLSHEQLVIGHWYTLADTPFELVAIDESERCLEVQFYDGTIGELGISTALLSGIRRSASPVDYSGALGALDDHVEPLLERNGKWSDGALDQLDREALNSDISAQGISGRLDVWNKEWA